MSELLDKIEADLHRYARRSDPPIVTEHGKLLIRAVRQLGKLNIIETVVRGYYGGPEVHRAWLGGMLYQKRDVAPERMLWSTLHGSDKELDQEIAQAIVKDFLVWFFGHAVDLDVLELIEKAAE